MTIRIYGPEWSRQWIRPVQGGLSRLSYNGSGQYVKPLGESLDPWDVEECIRRMQRVLPLGMLGDYEILCLDHMLTFDDPTAGTILGQRFPGYIALSGRISIDLYDLITHEITHELDERFLTDEDRRLFFAALGQEVGDRSNSTPWHKRPQERLAEYVSQALWDVPIRDSDMVRLTPFARDWVRMWALGKFRGHQVNPILVDGADSEYITITATEGANTITVDGREVPVDDDPLVTADIVRGRFRLPMTTVGVRVLKGTSSWDAQSKTGTWRIPRRPR